MKLFVDSNYFSPYAMSAFVALREKAISFDMVTVDLEKLAHHAPAYAQVSGTQRVPMLVDEDFHLCESSAICEYLEDRYPQTPIYPQDTHAKAKAREIQAWLRSDLMPIREERPADAVFLKRSQPPLTSPAQAAATRLFKAADHWLGHNTKSLFGPWSIADTDLALMLNRLVFASDPVPAHLAQFARLQWQRASVQAWVNLPRPGP